MSGFFTFENIRKSYGTTPAVDGVSLTIGRGEVFSLLGPSGCGKTTLLRMAAGFELPDEGRIILDGRDITALPPERRPLNTVFQNYALFPHLTVADNIGFGLRMAGRSRTDITREVGEMLDMIRLRDHAHKKPAMLSGGQKQRVAIARALVNKPQLLLLDEPLAALDLKLRQHMLAELRSIHQTAGITFIFVTHDQTEAMGLSSHIAVMNSGRIEQIGSPRDLYERPASRFVAGFIGDANFLPAKVLSAAQDSRVQIFQQELGTFPATSTRVFQKGSDVECILRPEHITVSSQTQPDGDERHSCAAEIEETVYLGASTRWTLRAGGRRIIATASSQPQDAALLVNGAKVWMSFNPAHATVLARSTSSEA